MPGQFEIPPASKEPGQKPAPSAPAGQVPDPDNRTIFQRLNAVWKEIEPIKKRQGGDLPYPIRKTEDIYNAITDILSRHGVFMFPFLVKLETEERISKKYDGGQVREKVLIYRIATVDYHVWGLKGDHLPVPIRVAGEAMDSGDKATSQAQTGADKVCLLQAFKIPTAGQDSSSTDEASGPARGQGGRRPWPHFDRYRYGDQAKEKPLTAGSYEYLAKYGREMAEALSAGKPYADQKHLDAIHAEIQHRDRAMAAEKVAVEASKGPEECAGCGGLIENGFCTACGLGVDSQPPG